VSAGACSRVLLVVEEALAKGLLESLVKSRTARHRSVTPLHVEQLASELEVQFISPARLAQKIHLLDAERKVVVDGGAGVRVACWTSGKNYKNLPIWYQITAPVAGYIPAFNLDAHFSPAKGIPHCLVPTFSTPFYALEVNLHIRTEPSIGAPISGYLANVGSKVVVSCYQSGTAIYGDPVWYHAVAPIVGYVAGRLLNTGGDPAPNVPHC